MSKILVGLEGAVCLIDDILVYRKDAEEHDARLRAVLKRLEAEVLTLNRDKCSFKATQSSSYSAQLRHGSSTTERGEF